MNWFDLKCEAKFMLTLDVGVHACIRVHVCMCACVHVCCVHVCMCACVLCAVCCVLCAIYFECEY